jgi:hypothetical protein
MIMNGFEVETMIYRTEDDEIFNLHQNNRPINQSNVRKKMKSLTKVRKLLSPIKVDKNFNVIDGNHRIVAIRELKRNGIIIPISFYMTEDDSEDNMIEMNVEVRTWKLKDYVLKYSKQGKEQYQIIMRIANKYNVSIDDVVTVPFSGSGTGNVSDKVKNGTFSYHDWEKVEEYFEYLIELKEMIRIHKNFKRSMFSVFTHRNFDTLHFYKVVKNKFISDGELIEFSTSMPVCKEQILDLFNTRRTKSKIEYFRTSDKKIIIQE